jgi:hypothetical protein
MKNEKMFPLLLRVAALIFSLASLLCLVWANLDLISEVLGRLREKLQERREGCLRCCFQADDEDEFEDWD